MINLNNVMDIVQVPLEETNYYDDITKNTLKIPLLGRLHVVQDKEGKFCASMVLAYWIYGTFSVWLIILSPGLEDGYVPAPVYYGFFLVSGLCLISFLRASLTNPGRVQNYSAAEDTDSKWNKCHVCSRMRPPRAHHCRRCGQCVVKMDHHCPWINNCVGENNHFVFIQLLFYAFLLGLYAFILVMCHFWVFPKCVSCDKEAFFIKHSIWFMYVAFVLSVNMAIIMCIQLAQQHYSLLINKTTLERMIPQLGNQNIQLRQCYHSYRELCGQGFFIFWLCPIGRRRPLLPYSSQHSV